MTSKLIALFRVYWHKSLMSPGKRDLYASELNVDLIHLLKLGDDAPPLDIDTAIRSKLAPNCRLRFPKPGVHH